MTAAQAPSAPALGPVHPGATAGPSPLGFGRLMRAEWTKIRSVQSTMWSLVAFVVVAVGFSTLIAAVIAHNWNTPGNHPNHARLVTDPTMLIFGAAFGLGQLAICVLGAIVITSEYSSGAIRASLLAVPHRIPWLAAKAVVFALIDCVLSAITVFAVFYITAGILHSHVSISLSQPNVLRATIGAILYLTVLGLFALAIGGLIRHTAGAVSTVIGMVLVVPILVSLIPGTIANHVHGYLPTVAGELITQSSQQPGDVLSAWQGFGVFCLWTAALLVACGWLLVRRDA
jgi:ABC-2 type transport system permease protein